MKVQDRYLKEGATLFGIDVDALRFLGGEDGDVYEYEQAGRAFIFKLMPTAEELAEFKACSFE